MNYHISTGLIWEKYKADCACPLCEIEKTVEEQFLTEFLNDAVMEDSTRDKVNKLGFCGRHFDMLFARPNKLSVALQASTRLNALCGKITFPKDFKQAKKQAEDIEKSSRTCILCDLTASSMVKYYKTAAQMYANEPDFVKLMSSNKGFCLRHYAELLKHANCAGTKCKDYLKILYERETESLNVLSADLKKFCDKHDYRNSLKPLGSGADALPRTRIKLYGTKNI